MVQKYNITHVNGVESKYEAAALLIHFVAESWQHEVTKSTHQSSHLTPGKEVNKYISQNVQLLL